MNFLLFTLMLIVTSLTICQAMKGGNPSSFSDFPFHVFVNPGEDEFGPGRICGGAIVHERWVLTAYVCSNEDPTNIAIYFGVIEVATDTNSWLPVSEVYTYPELTSHSSILEVPELALLLAEEDILEYYPPSKVVPLISQEHLYTLYRVWAVGFGATNESYEDPGFLRDCQSTVATTHMGLYAYTKDWDYYIKKQEPPRNRYPTSDVCMSIYPDYNVIQHFCFGNEYCMPCFGDEGSPLVFYTTDEYNRFVAHIAGVVTRVSDDCNSPAMAIKMLVDVKFWITKTIDRQTY